ncbi:YcxB family protein [Algoriphagus sp. H41]|uniref:YcxB family protein n=1 Tax=Algoriphagus oliviformis TaxID=2811231 RepID=A0ABS3C588_9BACT|nr:YcxB family protein [Algoriphagus oliviformis]MBN7812288.1 YcxB family protein [Algoriphagus oliviformis]
MKFGLVFGLFMLLCIFIPYAAKIPFWTEFPIIPFAIAFTMTFIPPFLILRSAKKNYESNKMLSGETEYEFTKDFIRTSGESFDSKMYWKKLHEIKLTRSWLLIWQSKEIANAIPRRDVSDSQIALIKELVKDVKELKKSF